MPIWATLAVAAFAASGGVLGAWLKFRTDKPTSMATALELVVNTVRSDYDRVTQEQRNLRTEFDTMRLEYEIERRWNKLLVNHIEAGSPPPPPERPTAP